jgi:class 3 adenylate cyclase
MTVCSTCGQENPPIAKFCLQCGSPLAEELPPSEERRLMTALFTDIVGSTASAEEMDPEDVHQRLQPYFERTRQELERYGGTLEKYVGDAVVAVFGAPVAHEDVPERAVRAALAIRDAIHDLNEKDAWLDLSIRIGVNTGEALLVVSSNPSLDLGMAAGDAINTAARIQSAAPVNGVLVGDPPTGRRATRSSTGRLSRSRRRASPSRCGSGRRCRRWSTAAGAGAATRSSSAARPSSSGCWSCGTT